MARRGDIGLATLLARCFVAFALTMALAFAGVYALWNRQQDNLLPLTDVASLVADERLAQGDYDGLVRSYRVGDSAEVAVVDGQGTYLYRSPGWESEAGPDARLTPGEIACLPLRGSENRTTLARYEGEDGQPYYVLTTYEPSTIPGGGAVDEVVEEVFLDADLAVVGGDADGDRASYTAREIGILTGQDVLSTSMERLPFTAADGRALTLLVYYRSLPADRYAWLMAQANAVWLALPPLMLLVGGGLVLFLNRTIGRPLERLDRSIDGLGAGRGVCTEAEGATVREIRRIGATLDSAAERLDLAERERARAEADRQAMLAGLSHDLKTPLSVASGYAHALRDGTVPQQEVRRCLDVVCAKCELAAALVGNLHEYAKLEHPDFAPKRRTVDLCELVRRHLAERLDELTMAGFRLEADIPEHRVPCSVDELQIRRVLDNLVGNSLSYAAPGTTLLVRVRPTTAGDRAELTVADDGPGMDRQARERAFDPFWRGDRARTAAGSGLGLSVVKRIVESHGGTVRLSEGDDGRGVKFVIELPLARSDLEGEDTSMVSLNAEEGVLPHGGPGPEGRGGDRGPR